MKKSSKYIGLDVHKETIAVAVAEERGGELRYWGEIENRPCRRSASAIRPSRADSRKEPFGHTGRLEPQPRGAVTRRAVAQRRSRAGGLIRAGSQHVRVVWFGGPWVDDPQVLANVESSGSASSSASCRISSISCISSTPAAALGTKSCTQAVSVSITSRSLSNTMV